jgi:hypothetical protein
VGNTPAFHLQRFCDLLIRHEPWWRHSSYLPPGRTCRKWF